MPKLCDFETCRKQASYGNSYGKPIRCKEHKEELTNQLLRVLKSPLVLIRSREKE